MLLLFRPVERAVDRVGKRESHLMLKAEENRDQMDLWVRFIAAHPLHCYRREKVDWTTRTPETIIHSPPLSILYSARVQW